jgi:hypothetical protein
MANSAPDRANRSRTIDGRSSDGIWVPQAEPQLTAADLRLELIAHVRGLSVDTTEPTKATPMEIAAPDRSDPPRTVGVPAPTEDDYEPRRSDSGGKRKSADGRRRWRFVPIAGAAGAVAAGIGGGTAVAYIVSQGSGSGQTVSSGPVAVAIAATAGSSDLLPGQPGAVSFTLHNPASSEATLTQITPGATIISNNTALCPSSDVSIAPTLPYTLPSPITVGPSATSGTQSLAKFVTLAVDAPGSCQGVTFSVDFTLSGDS